MAFACKLCIAKHGLRGNDIKHLPQTEAELAEHVESVHHIAVRRPDETEAQAWARLVDAHPEVLTCKECIEVGAPWTKIG